jgi:hypothetical protein
MEGKPASRFVRGLMFLLMGVVAEVCMHGMYPAAWLGAWLAGMIWLGYGPAVKEG